MKKYLLGLTAIFAVCSVIWAIEIGKYTRIEYMVVESNTGDKDSIPTSSVDSFYFLDQDKVLKVDKSNNTSKKYDVSTFSNIHFCVDSVYGDEPDKHGYVDLGLMSGTLWATTNIGSYDEESPGTLFMWGKTVAYSQNQESWNGYSDRELYELGVISSNELTAKYDAANVLWGEHWRLPTLKEMEELLFLDSKWVSRYGVEGREFIGKNGKTLFIPANNQNASNKEINLWTSTVHKFSINQGDGSSAGHTSEHGVGTDDLDRNAALAIRPVRVNCPIVIINRELFFEKIDTTISLEFYSKPQNRILPSDVTWTSSDESVATVKDGLVTSVSYGFCEVTCRYKNYKIKCNIMVGDGFVHDYIDLGLPSGTLWATTNIGTTLSDGYGQYFAWGATSENENFKWDKMNTSTLQTMGVVDDKSRINSKYDVATVQWGEDWRLPSPEEFEELWKVCKKTWTSSNGVKGVVFQGPNGKSIFLPAAGYTSTNIGSNGYYWSSVTYGYNTAYTSSKNLSFGLSYYGVDLSGGLSSQHVGDKCTVRPVRRIIPDSVTFSLAEDEIEIATTDAPLKLTFSCEPANVLSRLDVVWSSSDETVATADYGFVKPVGVGECVISGDYKDNHVECKIKVVSTQVSIIDTIRMKKNGMQCDFDIVCYPEGKIKKSDFRWKVSDNSVVELTYSDKLLPLSKGSCILTGVYKNFTLNSVIIVYDEQINDSIDGVEYVDLGLPSGTLWAKCNIGANNATEEGYYFTWGGMGPFDDTYSSGNSKEYLKEMGIIDSTDMLSVAFDAATRYLGAGHKIPTKEQFLELIENCTVSYGEMNGKRGCCFVSKNNENVLFLPAAGYWDSGSSRSIFDCRYWSSSLPSEDTRTAYYFYAPYSQVVGLDSLVNTKSIPIRSVVEPKNIKPITIDIDTSTLNIYSHEPSAPLGFTSSANDLLSAYNVEWSSSDSSIAIVNGDKVVPVNVGECVITGRYKDQQVSRKVIVTMKPFTLPEGDYVDLGLPSGTLWATHNLGAKSQNDLGYYYSWGEAEPKDSFYTSKWDNVSLDNLKKQGIVDDNNVLTPENDAATVLLGENWKTPTSDQYDELITSCIYRIVEVDGTRGVLYESENGNCLFFPFSGNYSKETLSFDNTTYWASDMEDTPYSSNDYFFSFNGLRITYNVVSSSYRSKGMNIRPIYIK